MCYYIVRCRVCNSNGVCIYSSLFSLTHSHRHIRIYNIKLNEAVRVHTHSYQHTKLVLNPHIKFCSLFSFASVYHLYTFTIKHGDNSLFLFRFVSVVGSPWTLWFWIRSQLDKKGKKPTIVVVGALCLRALYWLMTMAINVFVWTLLFFLFWKKPLNILLIESVYFHFVVSFRFVLDLCSKCTHADTHTYIAYWRCCK